MLDGENIPSPVTVDFEVLRRGNGVDASILSIRHEFAPGRGVAFDVDAIVGPVPASTGDSIVLRFTTVAGGDYTPNGDGGLAGSRVPSVTLPRE